MRKSTQEHDDTKKQARLDYLDYVAMRYGLTEEQHDEFIRLRFEAEVDEL